MQWKSIVRGNGKRGLELQCDHLIARIIGKQSPFRPGGKTHSTQLQNLCRQDGSIKSTLVIPKMGKPLNAWLKADELNGAHCLESNLVLLRKSGDAIALQVRDEPVLLAVNDTSGDVLVARCAPEALHSLSGCDSCGGSAIENCLRALGPSHVSIAIAGGSSVLTGEGYAYLRPHVSAFKAFIDESTQKIDHFGLMVGIAQGVGIPAEKIAVNQYRSDTTEWLTSGHSSRESDESLNTVLVTRY